MENTIKTRRKELGLSQEELAMQLGVSRQSVSVVSSTIRAACPTVAGSAPKSWTAYAFSLRARAISVFVFPEFRTKASAETISVNAKDAPNSAQILRNA